MDLLKNQDKKYLPIQSSIKGFSCFTDSHFALYISDEMLYILNLLTGDISEVKEFTEISNVKCISNDTFVISGYESIYTAKFTGDKVIIQKEYSIDGTSSKMIDASGNLSIIVLSAYEKLMVVIEEKVNTIDMADIQYSLAISGDGKIIASGSEKGIKLINSTSLEIEKEIEIGVIPLCMSFSPDGKTLLYGDDLKNIVSINLETSEKFQYSNPFFSKPIYIGWLDEGKKFVISFLSQCVSLYHIGDESDKTIRLNEFPGRYFQYADLINKNIIAISVENLRMGSAVESVPTSDVVVLQRIID